MALPLRELWLGGVVARTRPREGGGWEIGAGVELTGLEETLVAVGRKELVGEARLIVGRGLMVLVTVALDGAGRFLSIED